MVCSLLRVFKLFFMSTSLFTANTTVWMHPRHNDMVAIQHSAHHNSLKIHEDITFVKDNLYMKCFNQTKNVFNMNLPKLKKIHIQQPVEIKCKSYTRHLTREQMMHRRLYHKCMHQLKEMREILDDE